MPGIPEKRISEKEFWDWFAANEEKYYLNDETKGPLLKEMYDKLQEYHTGLTYQFSLNEENKKKEFVISADGIRENFPAVTNLVEVAPKLERWEIIAFRPRITDEFTLQLGNKTFGFEDVYFLLAQEPSSISLQLHIRGYEDSELYKQAAFIILDNMLGEYDMETRIGTIEFMALDEGKKEGLHNIRELPGIVDHLFQQMNN